MLLIKLSVNYESLCYIIRMEISASDLWKRVDSLRKEPLSVLCRRTGLSYARVKRNRTDCRIPSAEDLLIISQALGTSMEYLLTGENAFPISPEARFVEASDIMRAFVRCCMDDAHLFPSSALVAEQDREEVKHKR